MVCVSSRGRRNPTERRCAQLREGVVNHNASSRGRPGPGDRVGERFHFQPRSPAFFASDGHFRDDRRYVGLDSSGGSKFPARTSRRLGRPCDSRPGRGGQRIFANQVQRFRGPLGCSRRARLRSLRTVSTRAAHRIMSTPRHDVRGVRTSDADRAPAETVFVS